MLSELERELYSALRGMLDNCQDVERDDAIIAAVEAANKALAQAEKHGAKESMHLYRIRLRSQTIDPECWASYTDKPREYIQRMELRRMEAIRKAREIEEKQGL